MPPLNLSQLQEPDPLKARYLSYGAEHHLCRAEHPECCSECREYWDRMIAKGWYELGKGWTQKARDEEPRSDFFGQPQIPKLFLLSTEFDLLLRKFGL